MKLADDLIHSHDNLSSKIFQIHAFTVIQQ
jgi:hypothetical protein